MQKITLTSLFFLASLQMAFTQSGLNSVYSAFGIGDVQLRDYNGYQGMGGLGVAMPSVNTLNDINPASYGSFTYNRMMMELSLGGKQVRYVTSDKNISAGDFTIQKAAMGISLVKGWATSFGIKRYSTVDYYTIGDRYLLGTESKLTSQMTGNGGLYNFYFSNGVRIGRHLRLGLTIGYLSGSVNRVEKINNNVTTDVLVEKNVFYQNFLFNTGLQYHFKTGSLAWIAGATFQPQTSLNKTEDNTIRDANENILIQQKAKTGYFDYPVQWSVGLSMMRDEWKFGVDYIGQNWSQVNYSGTGFQTRDAGNWSAGLSYSKPKNTIWGYVDGLTYNLGFNRDLSYLVIGGQPVNSTSGTFGISVPSRNNLYQYHFAVKVGQKGNATYPLVKEKFVEFNMNLSLSSVLYTGGRKYD